MDFITILNEFSEKFEDFQKKLPYNFNVLDEQCGHIVENSHTNILMKILQYKNQYGYSFLNDFFAFLGWDISIDPEKEIKFIREAYYKNKMNDSSSGRIDGLIFQQDNFAVIIENKVNGAGNQEEQIRKYIEGVLDDTGNYGVFNNIEEQNRHTKVWVIFLTKDGYEKPDKYSLSCMREKGICDMAEDKEDSEISGPRYAAVNYRDHILPWLKEVVQPCVMQKEQVLNTGLLQYIDFLEGLLGQRKTDVELIVECKNVVKDLLGLKGKEEKSYYTNLGDARTSINTYQKELFTKGNDKKVLSDDDEIKYRSSNILSNVIEELNDEPMEDFFSLTKDYFTKNSLMKECCISHIFNYYYIQIREASWPRSIHFEWYPLGIDKLLKGKKNRETGRMEYTFCFHVENDKYEKLFNQSSIMNLLESIGFCKSDKANFSYYKNIECDEPIMKMSPENLSSYLNATYKDITKDIIDEINKTLRL